MLSVLRLTILCLSALLLGPILACGAPSHSPLFSSYSHHTHESLHLVRTASNKQPRISLKKVKNLRYHRHPTYTRLVFDLESHPQFTETHVTKPKRAKITLSQTTLSKTARKKRTAATFPKGITISESSDHVLTVTINLQRRRYTLSTLKKPHRLILDLYDSPPNTPPLSTLARKVPSTGPHVTTPPPNTPVAKRPQDLLVIIDPGHGGKDPGAIGKKGTKEKRITLQIAKKLRGFIRKQLGARVLLTRQKDIFINLEDRVDFANRNKADLFVSIHVNSHPKQYIKGVELYYFGKASDPRALAVAARENGTPLEDNSPQWKFILADKIIDQKIDESRDFAWTTHKALMTRITKHYKVKDHGIKTAPFYVLRFTTMPGILAEVAFVSNPSDEKRIKSGTYQSKMAQGIFDGIQSYLKASLRSFS